MTHFNTRRSLLYGLVASFLAPFNTVFSQRNWPSKPIRAVVGFAPGGGVDLMVRALVPALSTNLAQSVVIENKAGASGNIATANVIRSPADGYSALVATTLQQSVNPLILKVSPDMEKGLTPVAIVGRFVFCLVVRAEFPANTLEELISMAKSKPSQLTYASIGIGSMPHLLGELFQQLTGIELVHVPYKGAAPSMLALMTKEVDMAFTASAFPQVEAGKMKILGVASELRLNRYPDIPTFSESNVPLIDGNSWIGVWVPKNTPTDIVERFENGLHEAMTQSDVRQHFEAIGADAVYRNTQEFTDFLERESKIMADIIYKAKIAIH